MKPSDIGLTFPKGYFDKTMILLWKKLDLVKTHKTYFKSKTSPEVVRFGPFQYLSIAGKGDPSGPEFQEDIQALYPTVVHTQVCNEGAGQGFCCFKT